MRRAIAATLTVLCLAASCCRPSRTAAPSAASTWPRPTPSCSTRPRRWRWCATATSTVLTMANDFQGRPKEFAIVVPVPTFIEREQIEVADKALLDHLDAYSAPRLVEYFDEDPCRRADRRTRMVGRRPDAAAPARRSRQGRSASPIEAHYTVGEYDILILSAKESGGLETWLERERLPDPAGRRAPCSAATSSRTCGSSWPR